MLLLATSTSLSFLDLRIDSPISVRGTLLKGTSVGFIGGSTIQRHHLCSVAMAGPTLVSLGGRMHEMKGEKWDAVLLGWSEELEGHERPSLCSSFETVSRGNQQLPIVSHLSLFPRSFLMNQRLLFQRKMVNLEDFHLLTCFQALYEQRLRVLTE